MGSHGYSLERQPDYFLGIGGLYRSSKRVTLPANDTLYISFEIPNAILLYGFSHNITVFDGRIDNDIIVGASYDVGSDSFRGYNFDTRKGVSSLDQSGTLIVGSASNVTGGIIDYSLGNIATPSAGANRATTEVGRIGIPSLWTKDRSLLFKYANLTNKAPELIISWVFGELEL